MIILKRIFTGLAIGAAIAMAAGWAGSAAAYTIDDLNAKSSEITNKQQEAQDYWSLGQAQLNDESTAYSDFLFITDPCATQQCIDSAYADYINRIGFDEEEAAVDFEMSSAATAESELLWTEYWEIYHSLYG